MWNCSPSGRHKGFLGEKTMKGPPHLKVTREVGQGSLQRRPGCQPDPQPGLLAGHLLGVPLCIPGGWGQGAPTWPSV